MDAFPLQASGVEPEGPDTAKDSATHQAGVALRAELANLKNDLDALILHQATLSDGELSEAYARILARLGASGRTAREAAQDVGPQKPTPYQAACAEVRQRPLQSVAAAALAGFLGGWLTAGQTEDH